MSRTPRAGDRLPATAYSRLGLEPEHAGGVYSISDIPADSAILRAWRQWTTPGVFAWCDHVPARTELHAIVVMDPPDAEGRVVVCAVCFEKVRRDYIRGLPFESCDALGPTQTYRLDLDLLYPPPDGDVIAMRISGWMQVCADCLAEARPAT